MFSTKLTDPWLLRVSPQGSGVGQTQNIPCLLNLFDLFSSYSEFLGMLIFQFYRRYSQGSFGNF